MARQEIRSLTGLRGVAALVVLAHHANLAATGPQGLVIPGQVIVDLFFALSGYVLALSYQTGNKDWRQFAIARLARIYPLHLVTAFSVLLGGAVIGGWTGTAPTWLTLRQIVAEITLTMNLPVIGTGHALNHVTWSIAVECWTYILVLPPLLWLVRLNRPKTIVAVATLASTALTCALYDTPDPILGWAGFARAAVGFAAGFSTYQCVVRRICVVPARTTDDVALLLLAAAFIIPLLIGEEAWFLLPLFPIVIAGLAENGSNSRIGRLLGCALLVRAGRISYGIYLIHPLVLAALRRSATTGIHGKFAETLAYALVITIPLAAASFRWVEQPAGRWMRSFASHPAKRSARPSASPKVLEVA